MTPTGISQYLIRWEQSFDAGKDLTAGELCPEHPHLARDLDRCIAVLRGLRREEASQPTRAAGTLPDSGSIPPTRFGEAGDCDGRAPAARPKRFYPLRPIAEGGLGKVSLALDLELHREVALKEIQDDLADRRSVRSRFLFEAEVTGKLEHPGVVPVYGLGCYPDGRPYYAMRFIKGESLHDALDRFHAPGKEAPLSTGLELRDLLARFVAVCNTIAYAHSRGVIHRDLKPANVMLGDFGETLVVDWGLAKSLTPGLVEHSPDEPMPLSERPNPHKAQTAAGSAIGTPQFMSPEQATGDLGRVGPASDIYGLGATLYHLLAGAPPFADEDEGEVLNKARSGDFVPPGRLRRGVPAALESVCLKAMARQPEDRYASALDLAGDVERWLADEPVGAHRETAYERSLRWIRRHRSWVVSIGWALTLGLGCLAAALVMLTSAYDSEKQAHQDARLERKRAEDAYSTAREAVDRSFTRISEDALLNQHGMQPLRKSLLADALEYYRRFLEERGDDPALKRQCADAHFREGRILELTGSPEQAVPSYEKSIAGLRELEEVDESAELLAALGDALNALGRVRHNAHELDDAQKCYEESATYRSRAFALRPLDPALGRALANSWMNIGLVFKDRGKPAEARKYLANAQAMRGELHGGGSTLKRETAMGDYNRGLLDLARDPKEAGVALRAALAGFDEVAAAEPNDLNSQFLLAVCCRLLGDLEAVPGQEKDAQRSYARSRKVLELLAVRNPSVPQYQTALGELLLNIGALHLRGQQYDEALSALTRCVEVYESLPVEARESARSVRDLAVCQRLRGAVLIQRGKTEEARKALTASREALERLTKSDPKNADYSAQLAQTRELLAKLMTL